MRKQTLSIISLLLTAGWLNAATGISESGYIISGTTEVGLSRPIQKLGAYNARLEKSIGSLIEGYHEGDTILQYGNWYGPGWWGGKRDPDKAGDRKPVDQLDAAAMRHDFAYLVAERQGKIYGFKEEQRLKAMADYIAVQDSLALDADPRKWDPPATDPVKANRYRDYIITGFEVTYNVADAKVLAKDAADWVTSQIMNSTEDNSNKYTFQLLEKAVTIHQNDWYKKNLNATDKDASVEEIQQQKEAQQKARKEKDEQAKKAGYEDKSGDKEVSLDQKLDIQITKPDDSKTEKESDKKPGDETEKPEKQEEAKELPADSSIPVIPVDCTIAVTIWSTKDPDRKIGITYHIFDGNVSGSYSFDAGDKIVRHYSYNGTIKDNIITGRTTWNIDPVRLSDKDVDQTTYMSGETDDRVTLNLDGTLSMEGTSRSNWRVERTRGPSVAGMKTSGSHSDTIKDIAGCWHIVSKAEKADKKHP